MKSRKLERGDPVPHVELRTLGGNLFTYSTIWQRRNLVLVALPAGDAPAFAAYVSGLTARAREFSERETEIVITRDAVPGVAAPGALVADRWGEIVHVESSPDIEALPPPEELLDWISYVQTRCPECEGETR